MVFAALLPPPTTATLRCFFHSPSAAATPEVPPEGNHQPKTAPQAVESALPPQASQQSVTTDADAGMTQDLQAPAPLLPPEEQDNPASTPENEAAVATDGNGPRSFLASASPVYENH